MTTLSWDAMGRETERLLANGVVSSRAYDAAGRETGVAHMVDDLALAWYTATYDAAGNRTGVVELDGTAVTYAHDALGQLTGEARGAVSSAFVYGPMGNRVTKTVGGATTTSTYDLANQLTLVTPPTGPATTLTHDAAGHVTVEQVGAAATTYTWDGESRLTQVDGPDGTEEYAYDADGLRVRKETAGGTVHYVLDGANVLIETNGSLVTQAVYTDLPGEWGSKFSLRRSGASRFYLPDHQGHSRQLTDEAGDVTDTLLCDAWGVQAATSGGTVNPFAAFGQWGYYRDTPERLLSGTAWWRPEQAVWMGGAALLRAGPVAPAPPKGPPEMPRIVVPDTPGRDGRNGGGSRVGSPRPGIGIDPWPVVKLCFRYCVKPVGVIGLLCVPTRAGPPEQDACEGTGLPKPGSSFPSYGSGDHLQRGNFDQHCHDLMDKLRQRVRRDRGLGRSWPRTKRDDTTSSESNCPGNGWHYRLDGPTGKVATILCCKTCKSDPQWGAVYGCECVLMDAKHRPWPT